MTGKNLKKGKGCPARNAALGLILTAALCVTAAGGLKDLHLQPGGAEREEGGETAAGQHAAEDDALQPPDIGAVSAILVNGEDGSVLYEKEADRKMYPASTTKIMTALVALELCEAQGLTLDNEIIVPAEAEGVEGSSLYLKAGERLHLEELLYGLMLQSGNDSAAALAITMGGGPGSSPEGSMDADGTGEDGTSENGAADGAAEKINGLENFVGLMNEKARQLGCTGTHFTNPSGLHDEGHYTTARDLAAIAREAMKNDEFCRIVAAKQWPGDGGRTFVNKNKTVFQYEGGDGVKIGYTKASGRTLVASASRGEGENQRQLIAVVLNDGSWFADAYALLDYGFAVTEEEPMEREDIQ